MGIWGFQTPYLLTSWPGYQVEGLEYLRWGDTVAFGQTCGAIPCSGGQNRRTSGDFVAPSFSNAPLLYYNSSLIKTG